MLSFVLVHSFLDLGACGFRCNGAENERILRLEERIHQLLRQRLVGGEIELHLSLEPLRHLGCDRMVLGRQNPYHGAWRTELSNVSLGYFWRRYERSKQKRGLLLIGF